MTWQLDGMPLHPLLVHLTVVAVPTTCLLAILVAASMRIRRWAGIGPPLLAVLSLVSTVLSKESGENLEHSTPRSALLERHAALADAMVPWTAALLVVMVAFWAWGRWSRARFRGDGAGTGIGSHSGTGALTGGGSGSSSRPGTTTAPGTTAAGIGRILPVILAALQVLIALGTLVWVILVGDAGAAAVWKG